MLGVLGVSLVLNVKAGDTLLDIAPGEVIGVRHRLAQRIGVRDQGNAQHIGDAAGLIDHFDLAEYTVVRHGVVKGAAGMPADVDRRKSNHLADPPGDRRKGIAADEMFALIDQRAQNCTLVWHVTLRLVLSAREIARPEISDKWSINFA